MKAYTVNSFFVCKITGAVVTEISYTLGNEDLVFLKNFTSEENAKIYIHNEKKDWFLTCVEKFVHHKKHIIEASGKSNEALNICFEACKHYQQKTLEEICKGFIKGKKYFEAILPAPANNSYQSSCEVLQTLIAFCEKYITK